MSHVHRTEVLQGIWKVTSIKTGSDLPEQAMPLVLQSHDLDGNHHLEYVW